MDWVPNITVSRLVYQSECCLSSELKFPLLDVFAKNLSRAMFIFSNQTNLVNTIF